MNLLRTLIFAAMLMLLPRFATAEQDLAAQARDPTAPVTQLNIRLDYVADFHNLPDADQTSVVVQPVIPFNIGKRPHIARITLPYVINGPDWGKISEPAADANTLNALPPNNVPTEDINGLGDTSIFDFMMFEAPWPGRLALGISAILPTATDPALGTEKFSLGPAIGGVAQYGELLLGGIFLSNFSVAGESSRDDVSSLTIQPILSYGLGDGWSVELSEIAYNYDLEGSGWSTIPLGGRIAKMVTWGKQPVRLYADAEYNFLDDIVTPAWTFRFAMVPLL